MVEGTKERFFIIFSLPNLKCKWLEKCDLPDARTYSWLLEKDTQKGV
jgi:hypothetical protein